MSQNGGIVNSRVARLDAGRPALSVDWEHVDLLIFAGCNVTQLHQTLQISRNALNSAAEREFGRGIKEHIEARKTELFNEHGRFSVREVNALLTAFYLYPHSLNTVKNRARKPGKGPDLFQSPTTGKSLFDLVTYPQLEAVLAELKHLSLSLDGVAVRDGYEYPLRVWILPSKQSERLARLMEYSTGRERWEPTERGLSVLTDALKLFDREFRRLVIQPDESPERLRDWA